MDPIGEMLTTIRNSLSVQKDSAVISYSKIKESICAILKDKSIILDFEVVTVGEKKVINLTFNLERKIERLKRISKPGRRVYIKSKDIRVPLSGLGYSIISTPNGLMESRQAKKLGLGGEIICEIW